ncbi:OTU-domain-containing protein [Aspergillus cavernicola]|uniref:Ubiquitin thioesterase OTU n=1 Tax=Aspergillus cavernicola TaxID=176166 RepID=A0ABR4HMY9_9EURO
MRLRIRGPSGQFTVAIAEDATVGDLRNQIVDKTGLTSYDVKYGYPVKALSLDQFDPQHSVTELGVELNGEQLIITARDGVTQTEEQPIVRPPSPKLSLSRKPNKSLADDPPEVASEEHGGIFVLRVMADDNSCLFRAISTALMGGEDTMTELRSMVAENIQKHTDEYPEVVLEMKPDDYCHWIQDENSWGGAIELNILSKELNCEICSIDVQTLRIDRFNEGQPQRCILVYSGIHYDTIALAPFSGAPPNHDAKVFDAEDPAVLEKSLALCKLLQQKHYYTDTAGFQLQCKICSKMVIGQEGARKHAETTGHSEFGEAGSG